MSLVPVPGFGFLEPKSKKFIDDNFQIFLQEGGLAEENLTVELSDEFKCKYIVMPQWRQIFPDLSEYQPEDMCAPFWDNASCIPAVVAGHTAILPCMTSYRGQTFSPYYNASRECDLDGFWSPTTDYSDCVCNSTEECVNGTDVPLLETSASLEISIIIYFIGYVLSFLALCGALTIYLSFREMRCLRHKIHMGLFCAFGMSALNWIFTKSLQSDLSSYMTMSVFDHVYCTSWVLTWLFHLASFYWMFIEGLYLFLQVQWPLSLVNIKYKHFIMIGCGGPILNLLIWMVLRLHLHDPETLMEDPTIDCPFFEKTTVDIYLCELPLFVILFFNTFFLIWIMVIVVSKLREKTAMDHDRKHWKAAKALIIVMPILGIGYLVTIVGPDPTMSWAHNTFQIIRSMLLSTQGLVISLPYCYLNTEVQSVIRNHYRRWQLIRNVGTGHMSERGSISASTAYTTVNKIDLHQVGKV